MPDPCRLRAAYETARDDLLAERDPSGHWTGQLSSSALSTAAATSALSLVLRHGDDSFPQEHLWDLVNRGVEWLAGCQNPDGGWGDTDKSLSNIATTMLVRAAFHLAGVAERHAGKLVRAERYIESHGGLPGLRRRYGKDKTFAVPILTNCALAGLVPWSEVSPLPFEVAALPNRVLGILRIPVVSYAIPALVAIGQARYFHCKPLNPITRLLRGRMVGRSLAVAQRMQPESGGYIEATPLTSFVVMSLAATGRPGHPVVRHGVEFLVRSVLDDGSWPIDTNLATWVTTLSINALASAGEDVGTLGCLEWLLSCQHCRIHPFTSAAPGGWGWTDLSGAVPDADDTAGALLALASLRRACHDDDVADLNRDDLEALVAEACSGVCFYTRRELDEARSKAPTWVPSQAATLSGIMWLCRLQNRNGGWPTFCRGWGAMPFDRSGVDLTAHAIRALHTWSTSPPLIVQKLSSGAWQECLMNVTGKATRHGLAFLSRQQRPDGSWVPLWFGNQHHPAEENPVYGTSRVLLAYRDLGLMESEPARRGVAWLLANQGGDGGWGQIRGSNGGGSGGVSSVEETALAVEALLPARGVAAAQQAADKGLSWLVQAVESGGHRNSTPIGLYFAKLWYYEKLYPLIFTVSALGQALAANGPERIRPDAPPATPEIAR